MKCKFMIILVAMVCATACIAACVQEEGADEQQSSRLREEAVNLSGITGDEFRFARYYTLDTLDTELKAPQYELPLNTQDIANYEEFSRKIPLSSEAAGLLEKNGFVAIRNGFNPEEEDIVQPYKDLKERDVPIFITSDSLLHLYHIQFDETLRGIEEREFYDDIWNVSLALLDASVETYENTDGDVSEAAKRNAAFFAVGLSLLEPKEDQVCRSPRKWVCNEAYFTDDELEKYQFTIPECIRDDVERELDLIERHEGFAFSPIFHYSEDYSQYVPRGHYTRSEKLKNYFKAMMWYGRISFLLKGGTPPDALVSAEDAKIQTTGAALIASDLEMNQDLMAQWERIYTVTSFYVGVSDDLGPYEYREAMQSVFGGIPDRGTFTTESIGKLKLELASYPSPEIYGGTGACVASTPEEADECLESTKGFRLMGQRFIPDSYIFSNIVYPYAGKYPGSDRPFTMCENERTLPMGLDAMALLGSDRAREILDETDNSNYATYDVAYRNLSQEFSSINTSQWNRNLYWSWLYSLQPLLKDYGPGYPSFMQTVAWQDKELNTALASWTELRHDTILYAKQSYTDGKGMAPLPEKEDVTGYIEPVPVFYNRLLALTRMTTAGLDEMEVLDDGSKERLRSLDTILERLVELSAKELEGEELTAEDYEFIRDFGTKLDDVIGNVDAKAKKTTIVADVHTDWYFSHQVLEEGVGYVDLIVIAYSSSDGRVLLGAGPVMSYYEFKHPMSDRLTDEAWGEMLVKELPERPEWTDAFVA